MNSAAQTWLLPSRQPVGFRPASADAFGGRHDRWTFRVARVRGTDRAGPRPAGWCM